MLLSYCFCLFMVFVFYLFNLSFLPFFFFNVMGLKLFLLICIFLNRLIVLISYFLSLIYSYTVDCCVIVYRRIIEAMDDDEEQDVGEYIEKYNKKDRSTCKDVQDDYYSTIVSDDDNDFQDCNPHTHEKDTDTNNGDENGDDKNHTVSGFGHGVNNGKNNRNNLNSGKEKRMKNSENKTESASTGQQNTVLQVIENDMLSNNMGKTGDIYRSLRSR